MCAAAVSSQPSSRRSSSRGWTSQLTAGSATSSGRVGAAARKSRAMSNWPSTEPKSRVAICTIGRMQATCARSTRSSAVVAGAACRARPSASAPGMLPVSVRSSTRIASRAGLGRKRLDRGHEVEDPLVQPGAQCEHPDLDQRALVLGAGRRQVHGRSGVAHGLTGVAEVGGFAAGGQQFGHERRVGVVGGLDAVAERPVTGEDVERRRGGPPPAAATGRSAVSASARIACAGSSQTTPSRTLEDDQAASRSQRRRRRRVPSRSAIVPKRGTGNGVAQHGDDLGRRPRRRVGSLQGGRDGSRQRQRGIARGISHPAGCSASAKVSRSCPRSTLSRRGEPWVASVSRVAVRRETACPRT